MFIGLDGSLHLEEDDQCYSCKHATSKTKCPLVDALTEAAVTINDDFAVRNCHFYSDKRAGLSRIK